MWWYLVLALGAPGGYTNVSPSQVAVPLAYPSQHACELAGEEVQRQNRKYDFVCVPYHGAKEFPG